MRKLKDKKLDAKLIISMHDELQLRVHQDVIQTVKDMVLESAVDAGIYYNLNVPILADAKIGNNWADCH